ncbi:MAG TPA: hypothetical protein VN041_02990 [Microbacterium sp.]|nr:hypothetical protein [Microbacterium sp.]
MGNVKLYPLTREWRFGKKATPKASGGQEPKKPRTKRPNPPKNTRRCDRCGQLASYSTDDDTLGPHQWQSNGQWCRGGRAPSDSQRKAAAKAKRKRSVRASSGGLPSLGQR